MTVCRDGLPEPAALPTEEDVTLTGEQVLVTSRPKPERATLELKGRPIEPEQSEAYWVLPERVFRALKFSWEGPGLLVWHGRNRVSPFEPAGWEKARALSIGEALCVIVHNPTSDRIQPVIVVEGYTVP